MFTPAAGRIQRASAASFARLARHRGCQNVWRLQTRWFADVANTSDVANTADITNKKTLSISSGSRLNEIGVQQLSEHIFEQIFPGGKTEVPEEFVQLSEDHLKRHDLFGKNTDTSGPIAFNLPHFRAKVSTNTSTSLVLTVRAWVCEPGWTKYTTDPITGDKKEESVDTPDEDALCFDTEVMWKESPFAVMACAASSTAWYVWLSPWLLGKSETNRHLIPLGDPTKDRVIVGHNVGYDRARITEEYNLKQTKNGFLDTMSLHVAVNGMCSQQRPTWMKYRKNRELRERVASETPDAQLAELLRNRNIHEEEQLWVDRSSVNSLRDVAKFHLDLTIDKEIRNDFGILDRQGVLDKVEVLLDYCAADVVITHKVYKIVFTRFLEVCPHPVSFAALRHLSSVILPVNKSWDSYLANAEATYHKLSDSVQERLIGLAEKAIEIKDQPEKWQNDPWLKQLDWSGQEIRMVGGKRKGDPIRPAARQKKPGLPKWYKDLFPKNDAPINLTVRSRVAPILLKLAWDGYPMFWSNQYGWVFRVPRSETKQYEAKQMAECFFDESDTALRDDREHAYFKLPHKDGPTSRCANPLAKAYMSYFENGVLSSEYPLAKEALEMNASCSYWISARDRIMSQMVVYEDDLPDWKSGTKPADNLNGFILPQVIPMGTITRRAVENTWLTASNAKKNRVGSELKAMVKAPEGYCFVGADVDSEELWIASLMGDATFKMHGGNAIGFMTLEGTKAAGTDLHSRTASILGISRNNAKVFNYGRIYGAGLNFAATLLRQFNPSLSDQETAEVASKLYANTKGAKTNRKLIHKRAFWRGGTESFVFNKLEEFAEQEKPRTPVLGAGITEALMSRYINRGAYLTSRINWAIQSSGVDYLHLLIVSMDYLIRRFGLEARLAITVHDEIRYLVKNEDKYRAALALQVANIWTRAMFAQQVGINDLPQSCAFFSAVDIDHVLRKEVDMDCVTPSQPIPIPHGESIDIQALLDKGDEARLDSKVNLDLEYAQRMNEIEYKARTPVMQEIQEASGDTTTFIKAQITSTEEELANIMKEIRKAQLQNPKPASTKSTRSVLPYRSYPRMVPVAEKEFKSVSEIMMAKTESRMGGGKSWASYPRNNGKGSQPSSTI
ncbi:Mitochondrial DNA polymerase catalytic subunit [Cladobotryum mycophilum]|uniref:DNA-directed DNA polymerase n=1 Tax=Cladobotryum mycophilum TaxID=491253 RepID=A0ABR0SBG0_9HYPO